MTTDAATRSSNLSNQLMVFVFLPVATMLFAWVGYRSLLSGQLAVAMVSFVAVAISLLSEYSLYNRLSRST